MTLFSVKPTEDTVGFGQYGILTVLINQRHSHAPEPWYFHKAIGFQLIYLSSLQLRESQTK